jgi:hypothetical protein
VQSGPAAEAHANGHVHFRARKIHRVAAGVETQFHAGFEVVEAADARQQPSLQERRQQGDLQRTLGAMLFEVLHRRLELVEPATDTRQELLSFGGELDTPARPLEQLDLEVVLQRFDLLADRRRGHVQRLGRIGE